MIRIKTRACFQEAIQLLNMNQIQAIILCLRYYASHARTETTRSGQDVARLRHLSLRTEESYRAWIRRLILFHGKRHPWDLDAEAVRAFSRTWPSKGTLPLRPKIRRLTL